MKVTGSPALSASPVDCRVGGVGEMDMHWSDCAVHNAPRTPLESAIVDGLKLSMYGGKGTITAFVFGART